MVIFDLRSCRAGGPLSAHHFSPHDCASRTVLNRTGSIRQGKAFIGNCVASKYSRSRIAPIEPVFSCTEATEALLMMPAFAVAVGSSIGVGFASATELMAMSNATSIQGFIGLASLLNAEVTFRYVGFTTRQ